MGNCSSNRVQTWVDDEDWDSPEEKTDRRGEGKATRTLENLKGKRGSEEERRGLSSTVVTIKITRKQLRGLLTHAGAGGWSAHHVVADIMSAGVVVCRAQRRRRWRPNLQRIPEASEDDDVDGSLL
ncbi:hypothetical protein OPV22_004888 [Ensete ventricosum]|uniref:Uncharacterized protein n=1 Tax=Ensete ventricosum TaxID=4639 RepID=A0AAV8RHM6_ENSVE|nr:hypothetical protein OPV22_004888 [Ensete ventricosum]RWW32958.1 hypothetical protein GW17_00002350 [Ensete ventricosum]RZS10024.1 hypothetical protein BHM03_00041181 [Ensete ventricosum]